MGGITAALLVPTVALMVRAKSVKDDYDANNGTLDSASLEDQRGDVTSANLLADVFLGGTIAALVTTSILYLTRPARSATVTGRAKLHSFLEPDSSWLVAPTPGGALARGRF